MIVNPEQKNAAFPWQNKDVNNSNPKIATLGGKSYSNFFLQEQPILNPNSLRCGIFNDGEFKLNFNTVLELYVDEDLLISNSESYDV